MITMLQSLFAVGIVFLCILTNIRGEQSRVFSTNEHYSWFNARGKCKLLTNESNFSSFSTRRLGWTNFSAKYLPWIEYLGCFEFRNVDTLYSLKKQVTQGEQLQECIVHCNSSQFFGLQKSTCLCLQSSNHTDLYRYIVKSCDTNAATCLGDPFGFCGTEGGREFLSVYQKVNIDEQNKTFIGNCLEFDNRNGRFKANNCATELHPKCYNEVYEAFYTRKSTKTNWTDAFNNCKRGTLASYNTVIGKMKEMGFYAKFWLSNTRRWKRILDGAGYPEFCVAARIQQNGDVERSIHRCSDLLPALCVTSRKTSTNAPSKPSSTLSLVTTFQRKLEQTSISLRRTVPDRKETTAIPTLDFQQTTLLVHEEFSSGLPSNDGYSGNDKRTV
ncbi:uncharacterized protein LOC134684696 [Mytilus trossulus]|uniref:uncharacterized protein LOC134684696 n=1 Tax=Mytilus trossulus TaxID=6551 RepID=UPI00300441CF